MRSKIDVLKSLDQYQTVMLPEYHHMRALRKLVGLESPATPEQIAQVEGWIKQQEVSRLRELMKDALHYLSA